MLAPTTGGVGTMTGLLALLDDVAALARIAAVQVDDIAAQAGKVGIKAAGVVIDDAAVTPKYVHGLPATRELPIVWAIARGSLFNKLVILLPVAVVLNLLAPWLLTPLLMLGGCYLCFEGAEKVAHLIRPGAGDHAPVPETLDAAHLERARIRGAIKTDFILSAEIMTISLAAIEADSRLVEALVLALVAIGITALVYGGVAVLVKADDVGLRLAQAGRLGLTRTLGRGIVHAMPRVMATISAVGTAAMLWVGGAIVVHGAEVVGWAGPAHLLHGWAVALAHATGGSGAAEWLSAAALNGLAGLALGLVLVAAITRALVPAWAAIRR